MSDKSPGNLLFIFSDQHTKRAMGCVGHPVVRTPNLDRLAESGTTFTNAYTNGPICVPARASLATGRYVHDGGWWDNCTPYVGEQPSWGHRLMSQGRRAVSIGKLHYRAVRDPTGFEAQHLPMHIMEGKGMLFIVCRKPVPVLRRFSQLVDEAGEGDSTYTDYDRDITARAVEWIRNDGARSDVPWALFVSLVCPHPPWQAPTRFWNLYPHDRIDMPVAYAVGERPEHPGLAGFRRHFAHETPFDEAAMRNVIAAYYGMISYLDDNVGKLLATLEETGLADRTRVLYTSDHGESMGQKGMYSKCNMYEESAGIPMIISGRDIPGGHTVDTPVQLVDVFPTIVEATGTEAPEEDAELPGTSLIDIANGAEPARAILSEQHCAGAESAVYMVRKGAYKYVKYMEPGHPPQLFDLDADELELNDLAGDPAHAATIAGLEAELRRLLDPEAEDRRAKAHQEALLEAAGGAEAVIARGSPGYTPAPGEAPRFA